MIKKLFFSVLFALTAVVSFGANLVGTWDVRNFNDMGPEKKNAGMGLVFGILGESTSIKFNADGSFFCNDTVSGKYQIKGDELVLVRDPKQVEAFKKQFATEMAKNSGAENVDEKVNELLKGYECDSLKIRFTKQGNKALLEINQSADLLKMLPFGLVFELTKQGTNGKNENLNEGFSVIGKWNLNMIGMINLTIDLKPKGIANVEASIFAQKETNKGKYTIKNNILTIDMGEKDSLSGEYVMGTGCIYLVVDKDGKKIAMVMRKQ